MSQVCLLGFGPLPIEAARDHAAAGFRTWQFALALAEQGLSVELLLATEARSANADSPPPESPRANLAIHRLPRRAVDDPELLFARIEQTRPRALVGAGTFASYLLARSGHPAPLWIDFFGDPIAEGLIASAVAHDERFVDDSAWMAWWCLRRGDRFSAVSAVQRLALIGQLGMSGRLGPETKDLDLVAVLGFGCEMPEEASPHPTAEGFTALFSGSFNSWTDGETLASAVELALEEIPDFHFVATGGEVVGFSDAPFAELTRRLTTVAAGRPSRVKLLGRVELAELREIERQASCGFVTELPVLERALGIPTRCVGWMARGLPVVTTRISELGRTIEIERLGLCYEPRQARSLVDCWSRLASEPGLARTLGINARRWVESHHTIAATTGALRRWAASPDPAADRSSGLAERRASRQAEMIRDQLFLESQLRSRRRPSPPPDVELR